MEYYQVLLARKDCETQQVFADLSRKQLKDKFLRPLKKETHVGPNDNRFAVSEITKRYVIRTGLPHKQVRSVEDDELMKSWEKRCEKHPGILSIPPHAQNAEDIIRLGEDVTEDFVRDASQSSFWTNPWVVGIGLVIIGSVVTVILSG